MKKIYLVIISALLFTNSFAQAPDMEFENWVNSPTGSLQDPQGWTSFNFLSFLGMQQTVFKDSTSPYSGSASAKIVTQKTPSGLVISNPFRPGQNFDTVGFLGIGAINSVPNMVFGMPINIHPTNLSFACKYTPVGNDTAFVLVFLTHWNGTSRDTVASGKYATGITSGSYAIQNISLNYTSLAVPDTQIVIAFSSFYDHGGSHIGSAFYIDSLAWVGCFMPPPTPTITQIGDTLISSSSFGNEWYLTGMPIPGANDQNYTAASNGIYTVSVTAGECAAVTSAPFLFPACFAHYETAYDSTMNIFNLTIDSLSSAIATSYFWDFGDGTNSTLAAPTHIYTVDSLYNVCMKIYTTDGDSCSYCHIIGIDSAGNIIRSNGFTLNVQDPTITATSQNYSEEIKFVIYPNPTNGNFTISGVNKVDVIEIFNLIGERIYRVANLNSQTSKEVDLSKSPKGIYFVKIQTENKIYNQKIIIQ